MAPGGVESLAWSPAGDFDCPACLNTVVMPSSTGFYTLTATDSSGCRAADSLFITLLASPVYIPNAFAPASGQLNDRFTVFPGPGVAEVASMRIYDRWGGLVHESRNWQPGAAGAGWDGSARGREAPPGLYAYFIEVRFIDGSMQEFKGGVTVVR